MKNTSQEIDAEAARWAVRLDCGPLDPDVEQEFESWLSQSPRHEGALLRACAIVEATRLSSDPVADNDDAHLPDEQFYESAPIASRYWKRAVGMALVASVLIWAFSFGNFFVPAPTVYTTGKGEMRRIILEDGSAVDLNTQSRLEVAYSDSERSIRLTSGEAFFKVAKIKERPFIVSTPFANVRAVGTAFAVRNTGADKFHVVVEEGVVELANDQSTFAPFQLRENMRVEAEEGGRLLQVSHFNPSLINNDLAWREGKIAFTGTPLREAVAEFSRYTNTPIILDGAEIGDRKIAGYFALDDPEAFTNSVAKILDLQVNREGRTIHITDGQAAP